MMRALVKRYPKPGLWMEEVPIPKVGISEVLIKVLKSGVCGTDLHIYHWDDWAQRNIHPPRIIGHEFVGEIVEIGPGVKGYSVSDRVTGEGHINCAVCRNCRAGKRHLCNKALTLGGTYDGAFAEYLVLPASNLWHVHPDIPSEVAAIFDPFGNAVHCVLSFDIVGADVLITGAGPIGIMAIAVCRFASARRVVISDINRYRLELARQMGATKTVQIPEESVDDAMKELKMSNGFDIGLEMSGSPDALNEMIEHMYNGGSIALLGFLPPSTQINWDQVIFKGLHLKGIYGREMYETWYKMTQMLRSGLDISKTITHRFSFEKYEDAFDVVHKGECGKVILEWD